MIGFILFVVAYILVLPMTFINAVIVWDKKYFRSTAIAIDIFANYEYRATWNYTLRKDGGYLFGKQGETISSALGKNKRDTTLTLTGEVLCKILDTLDKNHCIKSINDDI